MFQGFQKSKHKQKHLEPFDEKTDSFWTMNFGKPLFESCILRTLCVKQTFTISLEIYAYIYTHLNSLCLTISV